MPVFLLDSGTLRDVSANVYVYAFTYNTRKINHTTMGVGETRPTRRLSFFKPKCGVNRFGKGNFIRIFESRRGSKFC